MAYRYKVEIEDSPDGSLMLFAEGIGLETYELEMVGITTSPKQISSDLLGLDNDFLGRLSRITFPDSFSAWDQSYRNLLVTAVGKNRRGLKV
jgi:hypothetical protein